MRSRQSQLWANQHAGTVTARFRVHTADGTPGVLGRVHDLAIVGTLDTVQNLRSIGGKAGCGPADEHPNQESGSFHVVNLPYSTRD